MMANENDSLRLSTSDSDVALTLTMGHDGYVGVELADKFTGFSYSLDAQEVAALCDWLGYAPKWGQK